MLEINLKEMAESEGAGFVLRGWLEVEEADQENGTKVCKLKVPVLQNGSNGESVKTMQIILIGNNCSCGKSGADGKFGTATKNAVMMYQDKNGLPVTGFCDAGTWKKMLGL